MKFPNVPTQINFTGHFMQLRYGDREDSSNKAFTIVEKFYPSPEFMANQIKGNQVKGDTVPSVCLNRKWQCF